MMLAVFIATHWAYVQSGICSWFYPPADYGSMKVCASNTVPSKTNLLVINESNGRESRCHVIGTGPFVNGRVLDVSPSVRDALGFTGLARVRIYKVIQ